MNCLVANMNLCDKMIILKAQYNLIIWIESRLQPNIGFTLWHVWQYSRVWLWLHRKWIVFGEIWSSLGTLSGAGPGRFWGRSVQ